jgi:uncharacterized membrane protein YkgB
MIICYETFPYEIKYLARFTASNLFWYFFYKNINCSQRDLIAQSLYNNIKINFEQIDWRFLWKNFLNLLPTISLICFILLKS